MVDLVVVLLVVVGVVALLRSRKDAADRREHLQDRFGPEYDRAVADADDTRQAEARLAENERRREQLDVRPLTAASRGRRVQQWATVQSAFVGEPVEAVDSADRLVADVMVERGYPTGDVETKLSMLAADHADTVQHYRTAESHRERFRSGEGSTEDLRRAFVEYRSLFDVLVDDGVAAVDVRETSGAVADQGPDASSRPDQVQAGTTRSGEVR